MASVGRVISVNVGRPRDVEWRGETLRTSIFKSPVEGRVAVRGVNVDGDEQSDLTVHGGRDKAVYGYPSEHYPAWKAELARDDLGWGFFGENLTTEGLGETDLSVGDILRIGTAELMVTQPRIPCVKLCARSGRADMAKVFLASRRSGFYFAILREGDVAAGDEIDVLERATERMAVTELVDLYVNKTPDVELLRRALRLRGLASDWRDPIGKALAALAGEG